MTEHEKQSHPDAALVGIRVLDLSHQIAGPSVTMALALLGADVVKVVAPGDRSSYDVMPFYLNNANKRSIALDLKSEEGRRTVLDLARVADVFVENFAPGVVERLGLGYDEVSQANPGIIYGRIKGFAPGTEFESFPAFDPVAQAYSGSSSITGEPDGPPLKPGPDIADTGTGQSLLAGLLAALVQRGRTGRGQLVSVSMSDHVATFLRLHYSYPILSGGPTPRAGNGGPAGERFAPSGIFACSPFGPNDYVHVHCGNDRQWPRLARAIGREDLAEDERLATQAGRVAHQSEVDAAVARWTSQRDKLDAMRALGAAGVPAGAIRSTLEVMTDPDLRARGVFVPVEHAKHGDVPIAALPVVMSASHVPLQAPRPPGGDNDAVLSEWLGRSESAPT